MHRTLLIVHALCALALVGSITHHFIWSVRYLRGQFGRARQERMFLAIATALFGVVFTLGLVLYPQYKLEVRVGWLDAHHPGVAKLFDIKEHAMMVALGLLVAQNLLARRGHPAESKDPVSRLTYVGIAGLSTLLIWAAAVIGLLTVSYKSFGGGA